MRLFHLGIPLPRLAFSKQVEIQNQRLRVVYYAIMSVALALVFLRFVLMRQWCQVVSAAPYIEIAMWADGHRDMSLLSQVVETNLGADFCTSPGMFDYWWDEAGIWRYDNYTCLPLCNSGRGSGPTSALAVPLLANASSVCIEGVETYVREGANQLLFVTEFQETILSRTRDTSATSSYFIPTTEALSVGFSYQFAVPYSAEAIHTLLGTGHHTIRSSQRNILTVIVNSNGVADSVVPPSVPILLTVPKMLSLAGREDLLDSVNSAAGRNERSGSDGRNVFPLTRITGAEVVLEIACMDRHEHSLSPEDESMLDEVWPEWRNQHVCYVTPSISDASWTSAETLAMLDDHGTKAYRMYHGLRIRFEEGGFFYFPSWNNTFMALVDAIVLLAVPKQLLLIFMTLCLGQLSTIYKRVIFEPFNVMDQLGSMVTRLAAHSVQFLEMEDVSDAKGDDVQGISRERFSERLHEVLGRQSHVLEEHELQQFVSVCFDAIMARHDLGRTKETGESTFSLNLGEDAHINLETFSVACSNNEPINFETVIRLFDADRRVKFFEKFFTPSHIKKHVICGVRHSLTRSTTTESVSVAAASRPPPSAMSEELCCFEKAPLADECFATPPLDMPPIATDSCELVPDVGVSVETDTPVRATSASVASGGALPDPPHRSRTSAGVDSSHEDPTGSRLRHSKGHKETLEEKKRHARDMQYTMDDLLDREQRLEQLLVKERQNDLFVAGQIAELSARMTSVESLAARMTSDEALAARMASLESRLANSVVEGVWPRLAELEAKVAEATALIEPRLAAAEVRMAEWEARSSNEAAESLSRFARLEQSMRWIAEGETITDLKSLHKSAANAAGLTLDQAGSAIAAAAAAASDGLQSATVSPGRPAAQHLPDFPPSHAPGSDVTTAVHWRHELESIASSSVVDDDAASAPRVQRLQGKDHTWLGACSSARSPSRTKKMMIMPCLGGRA